MDLEIPTDKQESRLKAVPSRFLIYLHIYPGELAASEGNGESKDIWARVLSGEVVWNFTNIREMIWVDTR